jgi:hypothetical protein
MAVPIRSPAAGQALDRLVVVVGIPCGDSPCGQPRTRGAAEVISSDRDKHPGRTPSPPNMWGRQCAGDAWPAGQPGFLAL